MNHLEPRPRQNTKYSRSELSPVSVQDGEEGLRLVSKPVLSLVLAGVIVIGLVTGYLLLKRDEVTPGSRTAGMDAPRDTMETLPELAPEMGALLNADPIKVARAFAMGETVEERLMLARNADLVSGRLTGYAPQARGEVPTEIQPMGFGTNGEIQYPLFKAGFANGDTRLLAVVPTPEGAKVDWDCYARYGDESWNDITSAKVKAATVRVFAGKARYFNFGFSNEESWNCYRITTPDLEGPIYGYVEKGTPVDDEMKEAFGGNPGQARRLILALDIRKGDMKNKQVRIAGVVSKGWVLADG